MTDEDAGMYDPETGKIDIEGAELALGIDEEAKVYYRNMAILHIIKDRLEISEAEIQQQYEQTLKAQLREARDSIESLVRGGLDG